MGSGAKGHEGAGIHAYLLGLHLPLSQYEKLLEGGWHPPFNKAILALRMASTPLSPLAGLDTWKGLPYSVGQQA